MGRGVPSSGLEHFSFFRSRRRFRSLLSFWSLTAALDNVKEVENEQDHQDGAEAAAGTVTPGAAVGPGRHRTDHAEDEDDEENSDHTLESERHWAVDAGVGGFPKQTCLPAMLRIPTREPEARRSCRLRWCGRRDLSAPSFGMGCWWSGTGMCRSRPSIRDRGR